MISQRSPQGFIYHGDDYREDTICQIVERVTNADMLLDVGPCFIVRHADGIIAAVPGVLLTPWFPV